MERKDLLQDNGKIFLAQGKALNKAASRDVRVLVVGNPCNTNCLILMHHAKDLPQDQFFAMTRLDQNRAVFQLAQKAACPLSEVTHLAIWGNHSSSQVPDFVHAKIRGKRALEVLDPLWLEKVFVPLIQERGSSVIAARGKSSAASAAQAILDALRSFVVNTLPGDCFSMGLPTARNPYDIPEDLVFSFPCRFQGRLEIVSGLTLTPFLQEKIALTQKELLEERDCIRHLL
jgi:malate dehydrogenase